MTGRQVVRGAGAVVAPLPYTLYAWKSGGVYICQVLRRHKMLFVAGWVWFALHVIRGTKRA